MTEVKLVACSEGHRSTVPADAVMTDEASTFRCPTCGLGVTRNNFETVPEKKAERFVPKSAWEKQVTLSPPDRQQDQGETSVLPRGAHEAQERTVMQDQIKYMVDRFLGWKLPKDFSPDAGISFKAAFNEGTAYPSKHEPTGTNLFDVAQAYVMVCHMLEGSPLCVAPPLSVLPRGAFAEPVAWHRWRFKTQGRWSKWIALENDEVAPWLELQGHHLETGHCELQSLYASPPVSDASRFDAATLNLIEDLGLLIAVAKDNRVSSEAIGMRLRNSLSLFEQLHAALTSSFDKSGGE